MRDFCFLAAGEGRGHLHSDSAAIIFREGCKQVDIEGASTQSFRRTALTLMSNAGIPLRVIQEISGHRNLEQLQNYLEVETSQVRGAMAKRPPRAMAQSARWKRSLPCPCSPQWPTARKPMT